MASLLDAIDMPPVWLALFLLLTWALQGLIPVADTPWAGPVGWGLIGLAIGILLAAAWEFWRHHTTLIPRRAPSALVDSGIYRLSRNPIYVADLLILAGFAIAWQAWIGLMLVPVLAVILEWRFIRPEERLLDSALVAPYRSYRARLRRWV